MADSTTKQWPGQTLETYPEVFTVMPGQPLKKKKPGQLSEQQVRQFFDEGFLIVKDFFNTDEELQPVRDSIDKLVDNVAQKLYKAGNIKSLHEDKGLFKRLTELEKEWPGANILLLKTGSLTPACRALWSNEKLLSVMEQLLGTSNITGSPVWNIRSKTPDNEATTVPWHQDAGYCDTDNYKIMVPVAWIPMLDATKENGCMQVLRGGHKKGKVVTHTCCWHDTWYIEIPESELQTLGADLEKDLVTCEVPYGGMVLMNNIIPHRSLNNLSNDIRWAFDFRWQRTDQPIGFHGVKKGVEMRSCDKPDLKIDWEPFDALNRHVEQEHFFDKGFSEADFDTIMVGPWMKSWEITNHNRHTDAMEKLETSGKVVK